jgi:hypothetical protein
MCWAHYWGLCTDWLTLGLSFGTVGHIYTQLSYLQILQIPAACHLQIRRRSWLSGTVTVLTTWWVASSLRRRPEPAAQEQRVGTSLPAATRRSPRPLPGTLNFRPGWEGGGDDRSRGPMSTEFSRGAGLALGCVPRFPPELRRRPGNHAAPAAHGDEHWPSLSRRSQAQIRPFSWTYCPTEEAAAARERRRGRRDRRSPQRPRFSHAGRDGGFLAEGRRVTRGSRRWAKADSSGPVGSGLAIQPCAAGKRSGRRGDGALCAGAKARAPAVLTAHAPPPLPWQRERPCFRSCGENEETERKDH